jgi:hypothetical protein
MMKSRIFTVSCGFLLAATLPSLGLAGPTWLCSISESLAAYEDGSSGEIDLGDVEAATFLRVDTDAKAITLLAPESRRGEVSIIGAVERGDEIWVITGVEEGRAWSLVISDQGYMTLSVTGDGVTWSVFGHALLEDE